MSNSDRCTPRVHIDSVLFREAVGFAEKIRAALTRREAAILDFYDIDYGVTRLALRPTDPEMVKLIREKIAIQVTTRSTWATAGCPS